MTVTTDMVAVALGQDAPEAGSVTAKQWEMWISDAAMLIESRRVNLGADPIDEAKIDYVVRQAVVAHSRHPDDATQITTSVDDASTSRTYKSSRGRITILDEWWALLGLEGTSSGAFAIDTVSQSYVGNHADICSLHFGGLYCSCGLVLTAPYPQYNGIYHGSDSSIDGGSL